MDKHMLEWQNLDPRHLINKRADIVILRGSEVGTAYVDTKEVYCIWTSFIDCEFINEKDKWNPDWKWIWSTSEGKYDWCPWKNSDPRLQVDEIANIVIVNKRSSWAKEVSLGIVDTTRGKWQIDTTFNCYKHVSAFDEWNENWWWIFVP